MPLTNTQYDQIMRGYQDRQLKRQRLIDTRREEIATTIPQISKLDADIASLSVKRARQLLDGDASAISSSGKPSFVLHCFRKFISGGTRLRPRIPKAFMTVRYRELSWLSICLASSTVRIL